MVTPTGISALLADVNTTFFFPLDASTYAGEIDEVFHIILWICNFFFFVIVAAMVLFIIRYRKKAGERAESRVRHNTILEVSWSVLPSFLLVYMFYRGTMGYLDMQQPPVGAYEVQVEASKWNWNFRYPGGINSPELHTVVDRPTKLVMRSADVIHSAYIPAFRMKRDVVPGRYNIAWFAATKSNSKVDPELLEAALAKAKGDEGGFDAEAAGFTRDGYDYFDLYCAEYCGTDHSEMQTQVVVHETVEEFEQWLADANVKPDDMTMEEYGRLMYEQRGCKGCHTLDGGRATGPSWLGLAGSQRGLVSGEAVAADENYLRESILYPQAKIAAGYPPVMPSYQGQLTDQQIDAIIAFMKTLQSES